MNFISRDIVRAYIEAAVIAFYSYGMKLERVDDSIRPANAYVSVPESSELLDEEGTELSGATLANRIEAVLKLEGVKSLHIKYRIRTGEQWTKAMSRQAEANCKCEIDNYTGGNPS